LEVQPVLKCISLLYDCAVNLTVFDHYEPKLNLVDNF